MHKCNINKKNGTKTKHFGNSNILDKRKAKKRKNSLLVSNRENSYHDSFEADTYHFASPVSPTSSSHQQKIKHGIAGNGNTYAMSQRTLQKRHKMQTLIQSIVPTPILVPLCHILAWSNEKPRCSVVAQAACSQKTHG